MPLEPISLINAGIVIASIQGCAILWSKAGHRGICVLLLLLALSALMNILEAKGIAPYLTQFTPTFLLLFGPMLYLACSLLTKNALNKRDGLHFLPALLSMAFSQYVQAIIALGTLSRLAYSVLTARQLQQYKRHLDAERSDSDEYSFHWMIWVVVITASFNVIDLVRLNLQPFISADLNVFGQGVNNTLWLVMVMFITYKLNSQQSAPAIENRSNDKAQARSSDSHSTGDEGLSSDRAQSAEKEDAAQFEVIFSALDVQIKEEQWFLIERLTLAQLSEFSGFQQRDISRAINLNANKSFNEYINTLRVDYVCQAIRNHANKSITELTFDAGFSSKAAFNRAFKQVTKMTPTQFKNMQAA